jgi:tRNA threonylcarbamoyladenosine biosynthesis protein TsaE
VGGVSPGTAHEGAGEARAAASYRLVTVEDTRALGAALAQVLRAGDLVVLTGPLGAGKTALTQGIGTGLGVSGVTSPTFVLAREHRGGRLPLVHVDAYRIGSALELDDLDLDSDLEDSVTVVEWGAGLVEGLAGSRLEVLLERHADDARTAVLVGHGPRWVGADLHGLGVGDVRRHTADRDEPDA